MRDLGLINHSRPSQYAAVAGTARLWEGLPALISFAESQPSLSESFKISRGARATQEQLDLLGVEDGKSGGGRVFKKNINEEKRGEAAADEKVVTELSIEAGSAATFAADMIRTGEEHDITPSPYNVDAGTLVGEMIVSGAEYDLVL